MSQQTVLKTGGISIGFPGLLTLLLIALKATGTIACSWWWVFAPLWIGPAIVVLVLLFVLAVLGVVALLD